VSIKIDMLPNVWTDINGVCFLCQNFYSLKTSRAISRNGQIIHLMKVLSTVACLVLCGWK
jgi:hypothetical protein